MAAITLSSTSTTLLPQTVTDAIFDQATEESGVMAQARRVPLSLSANTVIPVALDVPEAGWITEGAQKPVGSGAYGTKQMSGKKVALLVPISEEIRRTNPAGVVDQLQRDLPTALARAFDYAAIHGLDRRTGGAGPFSDYLLKNATSVEIGNSTQATGGIYRDLVNGEAAVINAGYDFGGYVADPTLRPLVKMAVDLQGRPLLISDPGNPQVQGGSLNGYPVTYSRAVSGKYRRSGNRVQVVTITGTPTGGTFSLAYNGNSTSIAYNAANTTVQTAVRTLHPSLSAATVTGSAGGPYTITIGVAGVATGRFTASGAALTGGTSPQAVVAQSPDSDRKLRAVGGDWSQCAYGVGMDITVKQSDTASYVDEAGVTHSAFQENLVLYLVEAYYGFVTTDNPGAFVAMTDNV